MQYVSRSMAINFDINKRTSKSGFGEIKVNMGRIKIDIWDIYNIVSMLSHQKLDTLKMKWIKSRTRHQSKIIVMTMDCMIPRAGFMPNTG